jgi:predicted RNA-binding Zn-ribbon protein involved in translation (DUF1610 family)
MLEPMVLLFADLDPSLVVGLCVLCGLGMLGSRYFRSRCPKCVKAWAVKLTGARKNKGEFLCFVKGEQEQFRCKYCGHTYWRRVHTE